MPKDGYGTIAEFIEHTNLNKSLLVGYYGGGNFGDELLLEILLNMLYQKSNKYKMDIYYLNPDWYSDFHKDFGHDIVNAKSLKQSAKSLLKSNNIIVGGGGLWGLDFNVNVMFLSTMLFISRFIFRKNVYLLGVGFYNSTNKYGRVGAWLAAKSANIIYARDLETASNFCKFTKKVQLDKDMSGYLNRIGLDKYNEEISRIDDDFKITGKTVLLCTRNFKEPLNKQFKYIVSNLVKNNKFNKIKAILEPKEINPSGYKFIQRIDNSKSIDFRFNPVAFYGYLKKHRNDFVIVAPHYHAIAMGLLLDIPFMPIIYDNKSAQLLEENNINDYKWLKDLSSKDISNFIQENK